MKKNKKFVGTIFAITVFLVVLSKFVFSSCPPEVDTSNEFRIQLRTIVLDYLSNPNAHKNDPEKAYSKDEIQDLINFYKEKKDISPITGCDVKRAKSNKEVRQIMKKTIAFKTECNDAKDNDKDGKIDMEDAGCTDPLDEDETNPSLSFSDDFDPEIDASLWLSLQNAASNTHCGSVSGKALKFTGSGTRAATTKDLDTTSGGTISFSIKFGTGISPCDKAEAGENVVLEYSKNSGLSWSAIKTYKPADFKSFSPVSESIPSPAKSALTRFRWRQVTHSGSNFDNWAIDNVEIK